MVKQKRKFRKYSPDFKLSVILDMREHYLGYMETDVHPKSRTEM